MTQVKQKGLEEAVLRMEQARNAVSRARKANGGKLRADQNHLIAELAEAQRRLEKMQLQVARQILAAGDSQRQNPETANTAKAARQQAA
jgi:hypothetical protein